MRMNIILGLSIIILMQFFVSLRSAVACDICAVYTSREASGDKRGVQIGVAEQFTHFGTLQESGTVTDNTAGQRLDSSITQVFANFQVQRRFGVQLTLPIIVRDFQRPSAAGTEKGTVSGVGDLSAIAKFKPYEHATSDFMFSSHLLAGIKLPTGSTDRLSEELEEMDTTPASGVHGHDLTLGTGSVDGIVGGEIYTRWQRLLGTAEVQYTLRTTGKYDYRFSNDLHWSAGVGAYPFLQDHYSFATLLKSTGAYKRVDTLAGAAMPDTGITEVFLGPDFKFTWKDHLSAELGAEFPLMIHNTALQIVPDYRMKSSVTWNF